MNADDELLDQAIAFAKTLLRKPEPEALGQLCVAFNMLPSEALVLLTKAKLDVQTP